MKTRLLIIIGIVVSLGSVAPFVITDMYQSQLEGDKRIGGLNDMRYDLQLQKVLDHCQKKELAEGELIIYYEDSIPFYYYNATHYIGTDSCQWHLLKNYPDSDILCIPGIEKWGTDEGVRNSTHIYDKGTCLWYTIISSSVSA